MQGCTCQVGALLEIKPSLPLLYCHKLYNTVGMIQSLMVFTEPTHVRCYITTLFLL